MLPVKVDSGRHKRKPSELEDALDDAPLPCKRTRRDELGHFARLSLAPLPSPPPPSLQKESDHVVYVDSLSDSETDEMQVVDDDNGALKLQLPPLLADRLPKVGREESLLPMAKPELALVLYRVSPACYLRVGLIFPQPLLPPPPPEEPPPITIVPPSSPDQSAIPLEDDVTAMDLD
jgi:hypothetical protein